MASTAEKPVNTNTPIAAKTPAPVQAAPMTSAKAPAKAARKPAARKLASPVKATAKPAVKAAVKPAIKTAFKPVVKTAVKAVSKPITLTKASKDKKPKLVRDSFTIPKTEYTVLDELKQRTGKLLATAKKSELIRAGIKALAAMSDAALLAALKAVPAIKTGRPKK